MSAASDFTQASWVAFSQLLDHALELPPDQRLPWLEQLGAEHAALKPALAALLQRSAGVETAQWLDTLPRVADEGGVDDLQLQSGTRVGPYRLLRELGVGGMGTVWLAERADGELKRQVALKLPRASWTAGLANRMARERDILASLEHPNIARLYDAGTDEQGRPYLALEYVEGRTIDVYCREQGLSVRQRVELLVQVARTVAFAHSRLVIHRDLKPSNILVTVDGQVRLLDFGIAKLIEGDRAAETQLTRLSGRALTPDYASPEQIRGDPIGTGSDVYSLGVVGFEVLTGQRPYRVKRGSAAELEEAVLAADVPIASSVAREPASKRALRGDLDAILQQALRKDLSRRYASAEAMAEDLQRWTRQEPVSARADSAGYRLRTFVRRNRREVGIGLLIMSVLLGTVFYALRQSWIAQAQSRIAAREARTAEEVQQFLEGIFLASSGDQADPAKSRRRTAAELLDEGAKRIDSALADSPQAKHRVLDTLAKIYQDMALLDRAAEMRARAVSVSAELFGPGSPEHIANLASQARLVNSGGNRAAARAILLDADRLIALRNTVDDTTRIAIDLALADLHNFDSDARGLPYAERAMALLRSSSPSADWVDALSLLGGLRRTVGDYEGARQALAEAERVAGDLGGLESKLPALYELWGLTEIEAGRADAGIERLRRVVELDNAATGPDSVNAFIGRMRLVNALATEGRGEEAVEIATDMSRRLSGLPFHERLGLPVGHAEAIALLALGRNSRVVERLSPLRPQIESSDPPRPPVAAAAALVLARAKAELGEFADAERLILHARWLIKEHRLSTSLESRCDEASARLQLAKGQVEQARAFVQSVERALPPTDRSPLHKTELAALLHLATMDYSQASAVLANGLETLKKGGPEARQGRTIEPILRRLRGEALLHLGELDAAIDEFKASSQGMRRLQGGDAHPEFGMAHLGLAKAHWYAGRLQLARAELSVARSVLLRGAPASARYAQELVEIASLIEAKNR